MAEDKNGWSEWSRHVLLELERLNEKSESIRTEIGFMKSDLAKISTIKDGMEELKIWKSRIDEIASPIKLQNMVKDLEDLRIFKAKAIMVWLVVQAAIGVVLAGITIWAT